MPWNTDLNPTRNLPSATTLCSARLCEIRKSPGGVVENLLGVKVSRIEFLTSQHTIDAAYSGKGVRLDAYLEDESRIFDIEIQTVVKADEGLRMRYYQGIIEPRKLRAAGCTERSRKPTSCSSA